MTESRKSVLRRLPAPEQRETTADPPTKGLLQPGGTLLT